MIAKQRSIMISPPSNETIEYNKSLLEQIVTKLNELLKLDKRCISDLFHFKAQCHNYFFAEHPTVVVGGTFDLPDKEFGYLRVTGLLNGLFTIAESPYRIAATYDANAKDLFEIISFKVININVPLDNQTNDH